jgi:hypothetical protein
VRTAVLGTWLLTAACAAPLLRQASAQEPVTVQDVQVSFVSENRAQFRLALDVSNDERGAGQVRQLDWELWLQGRWFAAGTRTMSDALPHGRDAISVELPVVFRRMPLQQGAVPLEVGVRGALEVELGGSDVRLPFQRTLSIVSQGAPVFQGAEDD